MKVPPASVEERVTPSHIGGKEDKPPFPVTGTTASLAYYQATAADVTFFSFIIESILAGDYVAHIAKNALDGHQTEIKDPGALATQRPGPRTRFLRENRQALLEMFLARMIDNFQKYLVDVIREILRSKPKLLSSKQHTIPLEEILKHERIEDLVQDIVERKVNALSYEGFSELQTWCSDRGIEIRVENSRISDVIELIATRNIIAHNRCTIDDRYLRAVKEPSYKLGDKRLLGPDGLFDALVLVSGIVAGTDRAAAEKFELQEVDFPEINGMHLLFKFPHSQEAAAL